MKHPVSDEVPALACDCHVHLFGPAERYPYAPERVYTPGDADEAALAAMHGQIGIQRVVIVQPSPYGTDNSRLLGGLQRLGSSARGVAVIDPAIDDDALEALHHAGIRGVRLNISTLGVHDPVEAMGLLEAHAMRIMQLGWHVQVFTTPGVIEALGDRLANLATPLVIDHFGLGDLSGDIHKPIVSTLLRLIRSGRVFIKLSAIERKSGPGQMDRAVPFMEALAGANPDALVWGSDWPHTGGGREQTRAITDIEPFRDVDDGKALSVLLKAIPDAGMRRRILVETPARLYDFPA